MPDTERSHARQIALQALCLFEAMGDSFRDQLSEFVQDGVIYADLDIDRLSPRALNRARRLAAETWANRGQYDELLTNHVHEWSLSRMPPVDRNILRLGLHELLEEPDIPPAVAIDEAIKLAKRFSTEESPIFVNGVLDGIWQKLEASAAEAQAPFPPHDGLLN